MLAYGLPWKHFKLMEAARLQLSAVRKDPWDPDCGCLVAARSLYKVQFLTANQEVLVVSYLHTVNCGFLRNWISALMTRFTE